jgi:hypothetical protein
MYMVTGIVVASVIAFLAILGEHWAPWGEILGHELPRGAAYVMGTAAILLPLTGMVLLVPEVDRTGMVVALWSVTAAAGAGTGFGYLVDHWSQMRTRLKVSEREAEQLRPGVNDGEETK